MIQLYKTAIAIYICMYIYIYITYIHAHTCRYAHIYMHACIIARHIITDDPVARREMLRCRDQLSSFEQEKAELLYQITHADTAEALDKARGHLCAHATGPNTTSTSINVNAQEFVAV